MNLQNRLRAIEDTKIPPGPILVLSQLGVERSVFDLLDRSSTGFEVVRDQADFVFELAKTWHLLSTFEPLVRHRSSGEETAPDHPWYGAEQTSPDGMLRSFAHGIALLSGKGQNRLMLISQIIFWEVGDCRPLIDFVMSWDNNARVLMITTDPVHASVGVAEHHQWQFAPSEHAAKAMDKVFGELVAELGKQGLIWHVDGAAPNALPQDVAEFIT